MQFKIFLLAVVLLTATVIDINFNEDCEEEKLVCIYDNQMNRNGTYSRWFSNKDCEIHVNLLWKYYIVILLTTPKYLSLS